MNKLIANTDNVVIGSRTLEEYKFQVINFMNMLYDNINYPDRDSCMTVDAVADNLTFELKRLIKELKLDDLTNTTIWSKIDAIRNDVKRMNDDNRSSIQKACNKLWRDILKELTNEFNLEYKINKKY